MSFMAEPAKVFRAYLKATHSEEQWYQYGMLAMALEIITRIKVLEDLPVTTEIGRQEAITVLHTMLVEIGISDIAYEWYDQLAEWRKPKIRPSRASAFEQLLAHALPSDVPGGPLRPGLHSASAPASDAEAPRDDVAPREGSDESASGDPSPSPGSSSRPE